MVFSHCVQKLKDDYNIENKLKHLIS